MVKRIVYTQEELEKALKDGIKEITLCAGIYRVPECSGVSFDRLGPVKAEVLCSKPQADNAGMRFIDTYPSYRAAYAVGSRESMAVVAAFSSGSGSSFVTSGSGSGIGSGSNYYEYEYEFEYGGSFGGSFAGSYAFTGAYSFTGSYGAGYSMPVSVGKLIASSFGAETSGKRSIRVYGYGINLI